MKSFTRRPLDLIRALYVMFMNIMREYIVTEQHIHVIICERENPTNPIKFVETKSSSTSLEVCECYCELWHNIVCNYVTERALHT
jgi:hypothetical protein